MRRTLLGLVGIAMLAGVAGCDLYFGPDDPYTYTYCDETGCYECDDYGCWGSGGGWADCTTNNQCAAGCYCDAYTSTCAEAGFCSSDADCLSGFVCDSRSSCVPPETVTTGCTSDAECGYGNYCD